MAVFSGAIETYTVNVLSPRPYNGRRLMNLRGSFGNAILWFYPEDAALPDNRKRSNQNIFEVHYPMSSWAALLDVLRNESPVYFNYSDTSNAAQIYTGQEPVGEEETNGA
jgi:hypothetical protein